MQANHEPNLPLHSTIHEYIKRHPDFKNCLKVYNLDEFAPLQIIIITGIEEYPNDEILGLFVLQRSRSKRMSRTFVQDYFVWDKVTDTFTIYTGLPKDERQDSLNVDGVRYIKEFWQKYGLCKYYGTSPKAPNKGDHLYKTVEELPDILRDEARRVLKSFSIP